MDALEYFRLLGSYNRWVNDRIYASCAILTDAQRKRDLGAFFKSIHGTLNHLLLADRMWFSRFTRGSFAIQTLADELYADFHELTRERAVTDVDIERWLAGLTTTDLNGELHYVGIAKPVPRHYPFAFALTHMFNHQAHHRGQVTTLLMQLGVDPGTTDLISLPAMNG